MGIQRRAGKPHIETHGAACAALRLAFHAFGAGEPVLHVVIGIDKRNAHFLGITDILVFADVVFAFWVDIGVVEKNRHIDAVDQHLLHQLAGAGRTAGMHQDA